LHRRARELDPTLPQILPGKSFIEASDRKAAKIRELLASREVTDGFYGRTDAVESAAWDGRAREVVAQARALLNEAKAYESDWNYGNALHFAHLALGLAALEQGDVKEASSELLAAGRTPGSPQLDTFGPSFGLAKKLLERGERAPVLEYMTLCARFWKTGRGRMDLWRKEIEAGKTPDFASTR
jgi:hypothetical protein